MLLYSPKGHRCQLPVADRCTTVDIDLRAGILDIGYDGWPEKGRDMVLVLNGMIRSKRRGWRESQKESQRARLTVKEVKTRLQGSRKFRDQRSCSSEKVRKSTIKDLKCAKSWRWWQGCPRWSDDGRRVFFSSVYFFVDGSCRAYLYFVILFIFIQYKKNITSLEPHSPARLTHAMIWYLHTRHLHQLHQWHRIPLYIPPPSSNDINTNKKKCLLTTEQNTTTYSTAAYLFSAPSSFI